MTVGSLVNLLYYNSKYEEPKVGMGATIIGWTDRHACTIVEVPSPKTVIIQQDKATRADNRGMSDAQDYTYEPDPTASKRTYTLRKNGRWVEKGHDMKSGYTLAIGLRDEYYDYSF